VLAVAIAAVAVARLAAPNGKRASFAPAVLGAQPPGAVVLAGEDRDLAVALALKPQRHDLLVVVTILGQSGGGADGLSTSVTVTTAGGRTVGSKAPAATLGTYQTVLAARGRPIRATVTVAGPGASNRPLVFTAPATWPPKPAATLLRTVDRVYGKLRTLVTHERLASSPTNALISVYRAVAPDSLTIDSSNGLHAVVIGRRRWDKTGAGGWRQSTQNPPVKAISPYWAGLIQDPTLLGSTTLRGHHAWIVSFAAPQIPAFFQIDVDKQNDRVLDLRMTASAHFMHHRYGPFNTRIAIKPPR